MMAGRSIPGRVFSTNRAIAISAPVLPALTQASALPSRTRSSATRIDESRFDRRACDGASPISTFCDACSTEIRPPGTEDARFSAAPIAASSPTSTRSMSEDSESASNAAGTTTPGPWSPPIASRAIVRRAPTRVRRQPPRPATTFLPR